MALELSPAAITVGVGGVVALMGYLVRFRQWTFLIAGYDSTSPVPRDVAADVVGSMLLRLGVAIGAYSAVVALGAASDLLAVVFALVVVFASLRTVYRLNTYSPDRAA